MTLGLYSALVLFGVAAFVDFVPTAGWASTSQRVSIYFACAVTGAIWLLLAMGYPRSGNEVSLKKRLVAAMITPVLVAFFSWLIALNALPAIATSLLGKNNERIVELTKKKVHRRRGCDHQLVGEVFYNSFPHHLCVSSNQFEQLPERGKYTLQTKEWRAGFLILGFELRK